MRSESETDTYKRTLEMIVQDLSVTNQIVFSDDQMQLRTLQATTLKIQVIAENALNKWAPKPAKKTIK